MCLREGQYATGRGKDGGERERGIEREKGEREGEREGGGEIECERTCMCISVQASIAFVVCVWLFMHT